MSHRRKNAHPLCKQKRIGSVVDRVLAAKTRQQGNEDDTEKSDISAIQSATSVKELFSQSDNSSINQAANADTQSAGHSNMSILGDSNQNLAIPDDLFKDFQALKNATNLDTADLMRKLIADYARLKNPQTNMEDDKKNSMVTATEETQDVSRLSEYYKNDVQGEKLNSRDSYEASDNSSEPLDLSTIKVEPNDKTQPQEMAYVIGQNISNKSQPLVVTEGRQGSHLFPTNIETSRNIGSPGMYFYAMGSEGYVVPALESSMKVPTVVHGMTMMPQCLETQSDEAENAFRELANKSLELQQQSAMLIANSKTLEAHNVQQNGSHNVTPGLTQKNPAVSQQQTEHCREVQFQNGSVKIKGTKLHPEIQVGELIPKVQTSSPMTSATDIAQGNVTYQLGASPAILENSVSPVSSGKYTESKLSESMPVLSRNLAEGVPIGTIPAANQEVFTNLSIGQQQPIQNVMTPTDLQNAGFAQNVSPTQYHNQMQDLQKIAARTSEVSNTTTKQAKNSKKSGQMKLIAENTSHHGVYTSVLKLPWSRRTRTPKSDHSSQNKAAQQQQQIQQQQQPMVLLPVTAGLPTSQGGVFIPATSLTMANSPADTVTSSTPSSANSMMMVYPNASFANMGRPIRKRGRPPKVPVLARMLADANKQSMEMQMSNFVQNFTSCPQPAAIVLNVNNMVNTASNMNSVNNMNTPITANASATTVVSANPNNNSVTMETIPSSSSELNGSIPSISSAVTVQPLLTTTKDANPPSNVTMETDQQIFTSVSMQGNGSAPATLLNNVSHLSPESPPLKSPIPTEIKTITTTSVTNTESGALYQEMILSSKSLVNVQPRRRQTTTELLKSKSGTENFICTSFRLRSLSGKNKEKKTNTVPGMKRRGRPPKRRLLPVFEPPPMEKKESNVNKVTSAMQMSEPQIIAQLYGQTQPILLPDNIPGETGYALSRDVPPVQMEGMNSDNASQQEPRLFDSAVDGNYDNPLLSNQFNVEHSQSDENLSQEENTERFVFSSDEEEIGHHNSLLDVSSDESVGSKEDEGTNSSEMFQKLFHCKVCDEIIPVEKKNEHREKHTVVKVKCKECGSVCCKFLLKDQTESDVTRLCDNCEKRGQKHTVQCSYCQEHCADPKGLKYHIKSEHPDIYLQQRTKLLLSRKRSGNKDSTQTKSNELKVYECPKDDCGKKFYSKFRIKNHLKKRHENQQSLPCIHDGCKKKFSSNVQLQEHIKFKHYSVKGYKCSWPGCDEEFPTERNLKVHLLIHKDEKPLKCDFCDYRCRQKNALNWHVRKHHPEASNALKAFGTSGSSASSTHGDDIDDE